MRFLRQPAALILAALFCICWSMAFAEATESRALEETTLSIPGPLSGFMRMAAISQKTDSEDILPFLAHNVFAHHFGGSLRGGPDSEYIVLLTQYLQQARELQGLAGPGGVLRASNCDEAKPLLAILGYQPAAKCGQPAAVLEVANTQRAFLTLNSGFPLSVLESDLQQGKPFVYPFAPSRVPLIFGEKYWTTKRHARDDSYLINRFLLDQNLSRLYWAISRLDTPTREALRSGLEDLKPEASVLDFYGSHIRIRDGRVMVPGGPGADPSWKHLVGEDPKSPRKFVQQLLSKNKGWIAVYFDALSRVGASQQAHFTQGDRLKQFCDALQESELSPDPGRPVFRPDAGIFILVNRVRWDGDGKPHVPGNLKVWKDILRQKTEFKVAREWGKRAEKWTDADQLLESLFALSRVETTSGPLQIYLTLSEIDGRRSLQRQMSPETVALMARKFSLYSRQYLMFSEFPSLNEPAVVSFLKVADTLDGLSNQTLRGNALGIFQANIGMWQILARQGQIPAARLNESWQKLIHSFERVTSSTTLFDAAQSSLAELSSAAGRSIVSQDEIIDLLAGPHPSQAEGQTVHRQLADRMRSVLEEQRLVSFDTLLSLGRGLQSVDSVKADLAELLKLAARLQEFEMPQPIFNNGERDKWGTGIYNNRHTQLQMRTDLAKVIKSPESTTRVTQARGELAQFLRDILVGLNYAYYNPPGGQMLHHNPLFVRSHDFSGETYADGDRSRGWQTPDVFGVGSPAGGGAHLVGSLADLPYVLARAEQDFIAPENVQSLIWQTVVPGLLTDAVVPRWWAITPNELHAVSLYQRAGEELLRACAENQLQCDNLIAILAVRMPPQRVERVERTLRSGQWSEVLQQLSPADSFYVAAEFKNEFPKEDSAWGPSGIELRNLAERFPAEVAWDRLSKDFGVPHPVLMQSYARELINLEPLPAFSGNASRLLAESWDSNNLYWARLADEQGYSPIMLNVLVPQLTHRMVEKIAATDIEDWVALGRASWETGQEFRLGKLASLPHRDTDSKSRNAN